MALVDVYIQTLLCNVVFPAAVITFLTYHYRDALHDCWKGFLAAYLDHLQRKLYSRHSDRAKRRLFAAVHDLANEAALGDTVTVVEMECSGGANFGYYPDGIRLLCTSSNEAAGSYIRKAAHKHPNLCVEFLKDEKNKTKMLPNSSADVVVTMFALSAVEGVKASLREALRILKPGGQLLFVDHVAAKQGTWLAYFQNHFDRFFCGLLQGHHVNRDLETAIRRAGFAKLKVDRFSAGFCFPLNVINPCIAGKAIKELTY